MLYKFKCHAAADVIMSQPLVDKVLAARGREPSERGVIQVAAMQDAIDALQQAMKASHEKLAAPKDEEQEDDDEHYDDIPFHVRAEPFLNLLKLSLAEGKDVVWGV